MRQFPGRNAGVAVIIAAALLLFVHFPALSESPAPPRSGGGVEYDEWWRDFGDPVLDSLVSAGLAGNYDLAMASRRINVARNEMRQAQSSYFPGLGLSAGWQRSRISGATASAGGHAMTESYWHGSVSMNWEIDLFGKITSRVRRGKTLVEVSHAERESAMLSVAAEIASAYIQLKVYEGQLRVARDHSERELKVVHITEVRHSTGLASMLDVSQAKSVYYSTIAFIPMLEASVRSTRNALAILLGTTAEELSAGCRLPAASAALPESRRAVPSEIPMSLLERRPDIVAARLNIEAAASALGIARKDYLPTLTLSGSIGTAAHRVGDLFSGSSFEYSVAPALSWTIFDGLSRRYAAASAREDMEMQIESYNLALVTAVSEVDNALTRYMSTLKYMDSISEVVEQSAKAEDLSIDLYKQGLTDFYNVVEAQLSHLEYQNTLISARGSALTALIDLYKALGGSW